MRIPKKVKIGGKIYTVEITDKLFMGSAEYSGEILYEDLIIRVKPNAPGKMEGDFIHELLHGIASHLGYINHDEKKIEELASALYMVIQDNPEIFCPDMDMDASEEGDKKS